MKTGLILRELHRAETDLAHLLLKIAERHKANHEIHHLGRDLATWSERHVREISDAARGQGLALDPDTGGEPGLTGRLREKGGELVGRRSETGLLLLRDLREVYVKASEVSVDWELLAQAAQAAKDQDLLSLASRCHPDTLRQARWANAMLKETSPQVLVG